MSDQEGQNQINIITGYGIEGRLNDGKIGRIIDSFMLDDLRDGNYSKALNEGFNAVVGEIAAEYDIELEKDYKAYQDELANANDGGISLKTILFMIIIFIIISNIINKNNYRGGGGGGFRRRRRYTYPRFGPGWSSWSSSSDSWGSSSFGGGSSGGFGGGFSGGGGSSGGGGAGRKF